MLAARKAAAQRLERQLADLLDTHAATAARNHALEAAQGGHEAALAAAEAARKTAEAAAAENVAAAAAAQAQAAELAARVVRTVPRARECRKCALSAINQLTVTSGRMQEADGVAHRAALEECRGEAARAQEGPLQQLHEARRECESWRAAAAAHEGRAWGLEAEAVSAKALEAQLRSADEQLVTSTARCVELEADVQRLQVRTVAGPCCSLVGPCFSA